MGAEVDAGKVVVSTEGVSKHVHEDEGIDVTTPENAEHATEALYQAGAVRTLDGEIAGDEFAADAVNYQILLGKIERLLERLKLDA